jgi:hypothetical protein
MHFLRVPADRSVVLPTGSAEPPTFQLAISTTGHQGEQMRQNHPALPVFMVTL